ncbi:MAG TPA: hypothetical protein VGD22_07180 [Sphingobacteriaceae bacterium]
MLIFPILYISAFLSALKDIFQKNPSRGLFFIIFGISIYNTTLSILHSAGFKSYISYLQPFKEVIILSMLGVILWNLKDRVRFHLIDYCIGGYFIYTLLYVLIPVGEFGFVDRLLAFKSSSFFCLIYLVGRLMDPRSIRVNKYFHFILVVAIAAAVLVLYEVATNRHFQSSTGYSEYVSDYFGQEPEGNYGLTWTFERAESGHKRFASFFSDPLEHASATLLSISVIAGLFTQKNNVFKPGKLGIIALAATLISVTFAISRSSMASYLIIIYSYAIITRKKYILQICHAFIVLCILYVGILLANTDIYDFIISTIMLRDESGLGHVMAWLVGLEAIVSNPLGLGLGASGRVAASLGTTIGGENQFIVLGVQVGIIAVLLYIITHLAIIFYSFKWFPYLEGKERMVALSIFLLKVGITLPLITANLDSYSYITYINWFLSGLFVNMIMRKLPDIPPGSEVVGGK